MHCAEYKSAQTQAEQKQRIRSAVFFYVGRGGNRLRSLSFLALRASSSSRREGGYVIALAAEREEETTLRRAGKKGEIKGKWELFLSSFRIGG